MLQRIARTRWLRFGLRDRVIRAFHHPDHCTPERFIEPFYELTYEGRFDQFIDWSIFYYGAYSLEELDFVADVLKRRHEPVFVDIGANVGQHSLFASRLASVVHAFEPYPLVADQFAAQIERNDIRNIRLHRVGLGFRDAMLPFDPPATGNLGTGKFAPGNGASMSLQVRNADAYFAEVGIDRADLIKIDTEGFEVEVLNGLRSTIARCRPVVFFEWTPGYPQDRPTDALALFPKDYRLFKFVSEVAVAILFRERSYALHQAVCPLQAGNYVAAPSESVNDLLGVHS